MEAPGRRKGFGWPYHRGKCSKTLGRNRSDDLSLTPASSTSSRPLQPRFCPSNELPGAQEGTRRIFSCEEDGIGPPYRQRGTGGVFRPNAGPTSRYLLVSPFHDFPAAFLSRNSCRGRV
ncbi:hypothetical protein GWK47_048597 [Chionoecetes opilio]|uniref:Uncharacterized protein n=1 Tax=Chionoecetes opilio TaxID=41210 RepID=A0A8J5CFM9_CHIOP|nr:hypothetical protein GWK47_048597 [Chionoecetes opilio]